MTLTLSFPSRADDVLALLDLTPASAAAPFHLAVGALSVTVMCPEPLRSEMLAYYKTALTDRPGDQTVHILPDQTLPREPDWQDWAREPGKTGRKDASYALDDARLVRKVRSGITFLQGPGVAVAFGPVAQNLGTTVNFINSQFLNSSMQAGWVLCHAAALVAPDGKRGLAISGLSGGGKSTSILKMMDIEGTRFLSNDRLLVQDATQDSPAMARGIPKMPRINPGTILGNPRLHSMIDAPRRAELAALPVAELRALEDKHDLMIDAVYGPDRICLEAPLTDFWVLNWSHDTTEPTHLTEVDLANRPDLLSAIVKSPGPFYQHPDGHFEEPGAAIDPKPYLQALKGVRVKEVGGRADFDAIAGFGRALFDD